MTMAAWREKKILFDEKTVRFWTSAELSERAKFTRAFVLTQFGQSCVNDKFDLDNAIQTKAEFSCAMTVMDKIGGWEEEHCVGSRFAARMWTYTKAVICNGHNHMQNYRLLKFRSILERVSEFTILCREAKAMEALQHDLANPYVVLRVGSRRQHVSTMDY